MYTPIRPCVYVWDCPKAGAPDVRDCQLHESVGKSDADLDTFIWDPLWQVCEEEGRTDQ